MRRQGDPRHSYSEEGLQRCPCVRPRSPSGNRTSEQGASQESWCKAAPVSAIDCRPVCSLRQPSQGSLRSPVVALATVTSAGLVLLLTSLVLRDLRAVSLFSNNSVEPQPQADTELLSAPCDPLSRDSRSTHRHAMPMNARQMSEKSMKQRCTCKLFTEMSRMLSKKRRKHGGREPRDRTHPHTHTRTHAQHNQRNPPSRRGRERTAGRQTAQHADDRCPPNHCILLEPVHDHVSREHANEACHDYNLKSGDGLISIKETFGLFEGRAEQHYYIPVRATWYTCVFGW